MYMFLNENGLKRMILEIWLRRKNNLRTSNALFTVLTNTLTKEYFAYSCISEHSKQISFVSQKNLHFNSEGKGRVSCPPPRP